MDFTEDNSMTRQLIHDISSALVLAGFVAIVTLWMMVIGG